jgi:transposase-like protein
MKKTEDGRRRFSRQFKIAAVRRVIEGEDLAAVSRDLELGRELLWRWKKRVEEQGEGALHDVGRRKGEPQSSAESVEAGQRRRIAELERLVGRQQLEIDFLDKALRRVEELRQEKNDAGAGASSKR